MELLVLALAILVITLFGKSYLHYEKSERNTHQRSHTTASNKRPNEYETWLFSENGLIVALSACVARSDGRLCELEAELLSNLLDDVSRDYDEPQTARGWFKHILTHTKETQEPVEFYAKHFFELTAKHRFKHQKVVEFLILLAFADGVIEESELQTIDRISRVLGIDDHWFEKTVRDFATFHEASIKPSEKARDPYAVLGVTHDDDKETVKRRYRECVKQNHPDIIRGKGGDDASIEKATRTLQEINSAYEMIKKEKGWS